MILPFQHTLFFLRPKIIKTHVGTVAEVHVGGDGLCASKLLLRVGLGRPCVNGATGAEKKIFLFQYENVLTIVSNKR